MFYRDIVLGAIGQIVLAVGALSVIIISSLYINFTPFVDLNSLNALIIAGSFVLIMISTVKLYDEYGYSLVGSVGTFFGLLSAYVTSYIYLEAFLGINYAGGFTFRYYSEDVYFINGAGVVLSFGSDLLLGFALVLIGAFFVEHSRFFSLHALWVATGIVYFVTGILLVSFILGELAYAMIIIAAIMGTVSFLVSRPKRPWS
jgi:hypothetical protein